MLLFDFVWCQSEPAEGGCELAAEARVVSRHNVDVANNRQVYFDGAMKYVACSHGCDEKE